MSLDRTRYTCGESYSTRAGRKGSVGQAKTGSPFSTILVLNLIKDRFIHEPFFCN